MIKRIWNWLKGLFRLPVVELTPSKPFRYGKSRAMIDRAGRSMKRGRTLNV